MGASQTKDNYPIDPLEVATQGLLDRLWTWGPGGPPTSEDAQQVWRGAGEGLGETARRLTRLPAMMAPGGLGGVLTGLALEGAGAVYPPIEKGIEGALAFMPTPLAVVGGGRTLLSKSDPAFAEKVWMALQKGMEQRAARLGGQVGASFEGKATSQMENIISKAMSTEDPEGYINTALHNIERGLVGEGGGLERDVLARAVSLEAREGGEATGELSRSVEKPVSLRPERARTVAREVVNPDTATQYPTTLHHNIAKDLVENAERMGTPRGRERVLEVIAKKYNIGGRELRRRVGDIQEHATTYQQWIDEGKKGSPPLSAAMELGQKIKKAGLSFLERDVVRLRDIHRKSFAEIGTLLGRPGLRKPEQISEVYRLAMKKMNQ